LISRKSLQKHQGIIHTWEARRRTNAVSSHAIGEAGKAKTIQEQEGAWRRWYHSTYESKLPCQNILPGSNRLNATNAGTNSNSSTVEGGSGTGNGTGNRATDPRLADIDIEDEQWRQSKAVIQLEKYAASIPNGWFESIASEAEDDDQHQRNIYC